MIRLRGVRVDPGDHLMYVRLLKIPGNYCLVLLCQIVPVLFDMAYSALKTPDSNLDCSRLSLEQGDYHLSDKVVLGTKPGVVVLSLSRSYRLCNRNGPGRYRSRTMCRRRGWHR